jgi:hypothetical protein
LGWPGAPWAAGLGQAGAQVRQFADGASSQLGRLRKHAHELNTAMGGFSNITRMAGAYVGLQTAREAITKNLDFERTLLETKQLAELTEKQAAEMRQLALDLSKTGLASPLENAQDAQTLANAGMEAKKIGPTLAEANRAAVAFRSTVKDIANLDFDLTSKFKIEPAQLIISAKVTPIGALRTIFPAHALSPDSEPPDSQDATRRQPGHPYHPAC